MTTMRESYERFLTLYGGAVERGSVSDAMLRGAFSAGVVHGLELARLRPRDAVAAIERMTRELDPFWEKEPPP